MRQLIIILFFFGFLGSINAQIDPTEQIKTAPGQNYFLLSGTDGKYRPTLFNNSGSGEVIIQVTINNIPPASNPNGGPILYINSSNGTVYTWNGTSWNVVGEYTFENGISLDDKTASLGGLITKNTLINDPTDNHDFVFQKGATSFGFQNNDIEGSKSWNVTSGTQANGASQGFLKVTDNNFRAKTGMSDMYSQFFMNPYFFSLARTEPNGQLASLAAIGSTILIKSDSAQTSSGLLIDRNGLMLTSTKIGSTLSLGIDQEDIMLHTKLVDEGNAQEGMFLKLLDANFGIVEFSSELPSEFVSTPSLDFNGDGVTVNNAKDAFLEIQNSLSNTTTTGNAEYDYELGTLDDGAFVIASAQNLTYTRNQNVVTITIPQGTKPEYLAVYGTTSNFSQEDFIVNLKYEGTNYNDTYTRTRLPKMSFVKTYQRRTPNPSQYWNFDEDFPPTTQKQITGISNGQVQCTYKNVQSSGTNTFICLITF